MQATNQKALQLDMLRYGLGCVISRPYELELAVAVLPAKNLDISFLSMIVFVRGLCFFFGGAPNVRKLMPQSQRLDYAGIQCSSLSSFESVIRLMLLTSAPQWGAPQGVGVWIRLPWQPNP